MALSLPKPAQIKPLVPSIRWRLRSRLVVDPAVSRLYVGYRKLRHGLFRCERRSPFENIYHCCTQKTASTWFKAVLLDPIVYKHTGLVGIPFVQLGLKHARIEHPLPPRTMGLHLYIDHETFRRIPKPAPHRAFFVLRDPRDVTVSWYFYARHKHPAAGVGPDDPVPAVRRDLEALTPGEGLRYMIDRLADWGSFDAQASWVRATAKDPDLALLRYEELARDERKFLEGLLDLLRIEVPPDELETLHARTSFRSRSGGRRQGAEDARSHFRKGVAGDWRNHFDERTEAHFRERTGDLVEELGYPPA